MTKMTMKNTVAEIKKFLANASRTKAVKADKDLVARLLYTSKALQKGERVKKADLLDLANDAFTVMAAAENKPASEAKKPEKESSLKKKPKKEATESKKSTKAEEPKQSKKTEDKKQKTSPKKEEKKEPKKKAFSFPEEFMDEDGIKYTRADDLTNIDEVREAIANDEEIVVAAHWTPEMLKEGTYGAGQLPKKQIPKRFEGNLDLLTVIFVGDITPNILTVSMYTEALYYWSASSLKQTKNGRKGYNLEFELYRVEDEEE